MLVYRDLPPHKRPAGTKSQHHVKSKSKSKKPPRNSSQQPPSKTVNSPQVQARHNTGPPPPYTYAHSAPSPQLVPRVCPPNPYHASPQPIPYGYGYQQPRTSNNQRPWMAHVEGQSCNDLTEVIRRPIEATLNGLEQWHQRGSDYLHHGTGPGSAICDLISSKFNAVLTSIDGEAFSGDERELGKQLDGSGCQIRRIDVLQ